MIIGTAAFTASIAASSAAINAANTYNRLNGSTGHIPSVGEMLVTGGVILLAIGAIFASLEWALRRI